MDFPKLKSLDQCRMNTAYPRNNLAVLEPTTSAPLLNSPLRRFMTLGVPNNGNRNISMNIRANLLRANGMTNNNAMNNFMSSSSNSSKSNTPSNNNANSRKNNFNNMNNHNNIHNKNYKHKIGKKNRTRRLVRRRR
jgi:hypothetical protein